MLHCQENKTRDRFYTRLDFYRLLESGWTDLAEASQKFSFPPGMK